MASGSSGRSASGSKGFDFGSDDVLCSYEDFPNQEASNGKRSDSAIGSNSGKDFRESRMGRSSVNVYNQQEEGFHQDVLSTVEKTMKKYADNLLRYLEGISGRLSQLELYCYNLERSIGEFRADLIRDHGEADLKLRSLEKHLQEVYRSVQILRDKQELADTQKELAKLQLAQKESTHHKEDGVASSTTESNKHDNAPETQNQQLALALPHQTTIPTSLPANQPYKEVPVQQPPLPSLPVQQPPLSSLPTQQPLHVQSHPNTYYSQQNQLPNQPPQMDQHLQAGLQYAPQRPQMQDLSRQASPPQPHVNPAQTPQFPPYQQQWPQQSPQQFPQQTQPQPPSTQIQIRPQTPPVYPAYPHQPTNPLPEAYPNSMPMQVPFSGVAPNRPESAVYGYGGPGRTTQQQPPLPQQQPPLPPHNIQRQPLPQSNQSSFGAPVGDGGYQGSGPHPPQPSMHGYMMYDTDSSRSSHQPHFQQGSYPPTHVSALQNQQPPPAGVGARHPNSQMMRNHPYAEMIEKAASMGYQRDQVANVIHRMEESGQPVDFNSLLDRLNARF